VKIRRTISRAIGLMQSLVGGLAIFLAFLCYYNVFDVQVMLGFSIENVELYMLVFIIFGLFSIISGLFLFYEQ